MYRRESDIFGRHTVETGNETESVPLEKERIYRVWLVCAISFLLALIVIGIQLDYLEPRALWITAGVAAVIYAVEIRVTTASKESLQSFAVVCAATVIVGIIVTALITVGIGFIRAISGAMGH